MRTLWLALFLTLGLAQAQAQEPLVFPAPTSPGSQSLTAATSQVGTASLTATLLGYTGQPGKWTYGCGFVITSAGTTTPTVVFPSLTGTTSPLTFAYEYVSSGQGILGVAFPGCLSSAQSNTNLVITLPGPGTSAGTTSSAISMWGYLN